MSRSATIPQLGGSSQVLGHVGVAGGLYPQLDVPVGPNERLALFGESGSERPMVKPDPVVAWVEGLERASVRGVDHRFGLVTSPITNESKVHREIDLFTSVASRQGAGNVQPPGAPWSTPPRPGRKWLVIGGSGLLEAHWLAGDLPGRHLQWTDLLGDFSFETFLEMANPVLDEFGVIMHGRP